jgi:hypothetical protein
MFRLMLGYYENVNPFDFDLDLQRKDHVVVLRKDRHICGFSTQAFWEKTIAEQKVGIVYSGDTIVDRNARVSFAMPVAFGQYLNTVYARAPERPLYWLLTSKGFRTFRAMSVFFSNYFPAEGRLLSDFENRLLEMLCAEKFPGRLDRNNWILKAPPESQTLKTGADLAEMSSRSHPDIERFVQLNPSYRCGDELICLARFEKTNVKASLWNKVLKL